MGLTDQSTFNPEKKKENLTPAPTNEFAKGMQKRPPPIIQPSKIPTVTVASNAFSVGQHEKQQKEKKKSSEFDIDNHANKRKIRFGSSEAKKNRGVVNQDDTDNTP